MLGIGNLFQKQKNEQPAPTPIVVKKKVLIVEDEPNISDVYQQILTDHGFDAQVAPNGQEGLRKVIEISPGLILLDLRMPVMDGKTMLSYLKNDVAYAAHKDIPVVILTNSGATDNIRDTKTLGGAREFIIKSNITPDEIVAIASKYLH